MTDVKHRSNVLNTRVIQVIEVNACKGSGVDEDPFRWVTEYWTFDGKKIADTDTLTSGESQEHPQMRVPIL